MTFLSLQKLSEAVAFDTMPFCLTGTGESWFYSLDTNIKSSFESIRQAIHNRFKPSTRQLQPMDVKQKEAERVEDFIHRVTSLTTDRTVDLRDVAARAEVAEQCRTTTPALQESTNIALLNALQEIREDVRENRQQHQ